LESPGSDIPAASAVRKEGMENLCDHPLFTDIRVTRLASTPLPMRATLSARRGRRRCFDRAAVMRRPDRMRSLVIAVCRTARIYGFAPRPHRRPGRTLARSFGLCLHTIRRCGSARLRPPTRSGMGRRVGQLPETPSMPPSSTLPSRVVPAALRAVRKGGKVVCAGIQ